MDPEARVVVTARDATGAAFASADKHLKGFARGAMQVRAALAGFGVVLSGRAIVQWMARSVEATEAIGEQRVAVEEAKKAFESYRKASDLLAESFAVRATPAVMAMANALKDFNAAINPEPIDLLNDKITATSLTIRQLQDSIDRNERVKRHGGFLGAIFGDDTMDADLARLRAALQQAQMDMAAFQAAFPGPKRSQSITAEEEQKLNELIGELNTGKPMVSIISQDELVRLESFLYELNQRPPFITQEELVALEEFVHELNQVAPNLTQEELIDLESFIYDLNHMESEAAKVAQSIGAQFQDAFAGWIIGADRDFKDLLKRMAAEMATSALFKGLGSLFGGASAGGAKGFFANFFGGSRANEGPVSAGKVYKVHPGEAFFAPGQDGEVRHMAGAGGASFSFHTTIDARGADQSLASRLPAILESRDRQLMARIKDLSSRQRF